MSEKIRVLLDEETVEKRICEVAAQISEEYKGKEIHSFSLEWCQC